MDSKEFTIELNQTNDIEVYLDITGDYMLTTDDVNKAEKIVKALEKQIPKRPREHHNWCDFSKWEKLENHHWFCKECDSPVEEIYDYCSDCGQKLDWGD